MSEFRHEHPPCILLLEDQIELAEQVQHFLHKRHYKVICAQTLAQLHSLIQQQPFDLLLLDRLVPDGDCLDHLAQIKQHYNGTIIMLTALGQTANRIEGYQAGADHYFAKPVDLDELYAVIQHILLKQAVNKQNPAANTRWQLQKEAIISPTGHVIALSSRELLILSLLIQSRGTLVKKQTLLKTLEIDDPDYDYRRLDSALYRIRNKVSAECDLTLPIKTVHGIGYSWDEPAD